MNTRWWILPLTATVITLSACQAVPVGPQNAAAQAHPALRAMSKAILIVPPELAQLEVSPERPAACDDAASLAEWSVDAGSTVVSSLRQTLMGSYQTVLVDNGTDDIDRSGPADRYQLRAIDFKPTLRTSQQFDARAVVHLNMTMTPVGAMGASKPHEIDGMGANSQAGGCGAGALALSNASKDAFHAAMVNFVQQMLNPHIDASNAERPSAITELIAH